MPQISVLSEAEVKAAKAKSQDPALIAPFVPTMVAAELGQWLKVTLDADDEARTIKRRMSLAAKSVGKSLLWKRDRADGVIVAEVRSATAPAATAAPAAPEAPSEAPAKTPVPAGVRGA